MKKKKICSAEKKTVSTNVRRMNTSRIELMKQLINKTAHLYICLKKSYNVNFMFAIYKRVLLVNMSGQTMGVK